MVCLWEHQLWELWSLCWTFWPGKLKHVSAVMSMEAVTTQLWNAWADVVDATNLDIRKCWAAPDVSSKAVLEGM